MKNVTDRNNWRRYRSNSGRTVKCGMKNIPNNDDEQQLKQLCALSTLMCVANYLNDGWKPNWSDNEEKWCIEWYEPDHTLLVESLCSYSTTGEVVFKTKELAQEAVNICGEQLVKMALGV